MARYLPTGQLDASFATGGKGVYKFAPDGSSCGAMALQSDGSILVGGSITQAAHPGLIARLAP